MNPEEVFNHLKKTFDDACRHFPDIMEPYEIRLADVSGQQEMKSFMRAALRETFTQRWPVRHAKPEAAE